MTAKDKFHKVMKEFSEGRLFSHDKKVKDLSQARAIAFSESRKINPKFNLGGLLSEQEGITDENAETFWIVLREIYVDTEKVNPTYRDIKWKYLPRENKNDFKRWLFTSTASDGMKLEGPSHYEGGIPGVIKETDRPIEVEGGEVIINKRSMKIRDHVKCEGTPEGIASRINELEGNGIKFSDEPGVCHLKKEYNMKKGKKIKSKIEKDDIQEMIIQDNELREKAEEGMKTSEQYIKINEPDIFEMMKFIKNEKPYYKKAVKFIFKGNDVCIYEYNLELQKFLDKYTIYYTLFDTRDEVIEYFMRLIPERRKSNLGL